MKKNVLISGNFELTEMQTVPTPSEQPAVTPRKKAQERINALRAHGIDTSHLFALGDNTVVRVEQGTPSLVADDDPVWQSIISSGTVPDRRLFRRWVLAQTFHMLRFGYTKAMQEKGFEYTWRMTEEELRVQSKLYGHDNENFLLRNHFFNKKVVSEMAVHYLETLQAYIDGLKVRHCHGREYKRLRSGFGDVFCDNLHERVIRPIASAVISISAAATPQKLYEAVAKLNRCRIHLPLSTRQSPSWVDAYKGAGAYFSLQNLIRFHGLALHVGAETVCGEQAISQLNVIAHEKNGYQLLGLLKEELKLNNIDINQKMQEWQKAL